MSYEHCTQVRSCKISTNTGPSPHPNPNYLYLLIQAIIIYHKNGYEAKKNIQTISDNMVQTTTNYNNQSLTMRLNSLTSTAGLINMKQETSVGDQ